MAAPPLQNRAAWQAAKKVTAYQVGDAPYTQPGKGQVVIRNGAVGINPFDWWLQYVGGMFVPHVTWPAVLGSDCAGTVVDVGPGVTRFRVGDRVAGTAAVVGKESGLSAEGAFQLYPVLREYMISPVPPSISDESAAVLGMAFSTAAFGLFSPDYLGLDPPRVPPPANPPPGAAHPRAVIVTGGASSLGACAVQLAASAGYEVVSTCSPRNFALVRRLGAAHVFDYARPAPELVADMVAALRGRALAGALTVGAGADQVCAAVFKERAAAAPQLPTRKFVALAGGSRRDPATLDGAMVVPGLIYNMMGLMAKSAVRKILTGIEIKFVMIKDVVNPDSCVSRVYQDFLGPALAAGQFVPAPDALVVGRGLEQIQEGLEVQKKGVSAQKVVVSLP